ncbi:MAG TPA: hypothetical protein VHQ42_01540 [Candidatus Limnocylindria bacterium]|nr:hypothetical protein [Candidatus Limnocylindria bacterium]
MHLSTRMAAMRPHHPRTALALVLVLVLVACGPAADDPVDSDSSPMPSGPDGPAPVLVIVDGEPGDGGISVAEAIGHQPTDDIVAVTGSLFVAADGSVLVCDAIAESFPPQCAGARLPVEGLDLGTLELEEANGVRWAERVTLLGSVE